LLKYWLWVAAVVVAVLMTMLLQVEVALDMFTLIYPKALQGPLQLWLVQAVLAVLV
jgi:hypothetical protein